MHTFASEIFEVRKIIREMVNDRRCGVETIVRPQYHNIKALINTKQPLVTHSVSCKACVIYNRKCIDLCPPSGANFNSQY